MANIPPLKVLPSAFAQNALSVYKNIIAAIRGETTPPNAATYEDGFGEATFKPVTDGDNSGLPPRGGDVNGILNELSTPIYRAQMGLPINTWDASIAAQGYPKGAVVIYPDGDSTEKQEYISLIDNNTFTPTSETWKPRFSFSEYIISHGGTLSKWYKIYNTGWCIQGGETLAKNHYQDYESISLMYPYINSSYNVITSINVNEVKYINGTISCYVNKVTSSNFNIVFDATNNTLTNSYATWRAEGYIS